MLMPNILIYPIGSTLACRYASGYLQEAGLQITDHPAPEVTHLLLDVPSFSSDGLLRGGGVPERVLEMLPQYITVIGGGLEHPALEGYRRMDLLKDEMYLANNAAITAECALQVAAGSMTTTFAGTPVLVIGWGRIGKCLARLLKALGAHVTVAARKSADRAMLEALGYKAADPACIEGSFSVIFNTAPAPVMDCPQGINIDLASCRGLAGRDVIWARGLPGIHAPESSGQLIADTVLRLIREG
jgi:hypothetical protein